MRRLAHFLSAPFRLIRAAARYGAGPVFHFVLLNVRRRGLVGAVRLGLADRRGRADDAGAPPSPFAFEPISEARAQGPRDLGPDYSLSAAAWDAWVGRIGADAPLPAPRAREGGASPTVNFVVQPAAGDDPAALAATQAAIYRLGRSAMIWPAEAKTRPPVEDWVVFLRPGDLPRAGFILDLAATAHNGRAEVVSFDLIRRDGEMVFPLFLPGANPTLLGEVDYLFGRVALRGAALPASGRLSTTDARRAVLDWISRLTPLQARGRWRHIGRPMVEATVDAKDIQARRDSTLARARRSAPAPRRGAGVVICTRDRGHLLRQLVRSLLARPEREVAEIVVVANGTSNPYALAALSDLEEDTRVRVLHRDDPFNFSRLCNAGAAATCGDGPLLFVNDDIVPVSEDWVSRLSSRLDRPEVGAVGPLLLYPDERVQHAGMYLGYRGIAGHVLRGVRLPEEDYLFTAVAARETSCLTGAVLLIRRETFTALNGFDEQFATFLQDVDLGLRLGRCGWLNIFEPAAVLIHAESTSIRPLVTDPGFRRQREAEHRQFVKRWGSELDFDLLHPAGFDPQDETLRRLSPI